MELSWGIFFPCINEIELIEAKIQWALRHDFAVSVCEGHHPQYEDHNEKGLSIDGTTETLETYSDQIIYTPKGEVNNEMILRDIAYQALPKDLDVVIMCDADEFYLDKDLDYIDILYKRDKNLMLTLTNSYIFLDNEHCAEHIKRKQSPPFPFTEGVEVHFGEWHERIFRYSKWHSYQRSPFLINDLYGRFLYNDPNYYGDRVLLKDVFMLHYKNFKMEEAKKRVQMYDEYDDGVKHDDEWDILNKDKIKYEGEHPIEVQELMINE